MSSSKTGKYTPGYGELRSQVPELAASRATTIAAPLVPTGSVLPLTLCHWP